MGRKKRIDTTAKNRARGAAQCQCTSHFTIKRRAAKQVNREDNSSGALPGATARAI
jgi:hypothetical protein